MASDHQVALTTIHRRATSLLNRTARQVVPAFLQKLYEMVSDAANAHLIRWSESGDSFFVLDHERFAREVLGRWFKHQNFSSFVRQLNMYGFHKVPHLQQGVLKSETDTEYWNFEHPHFHRGQPDMLCLIQRKKQAIQSVEDTSSMDIRDHPPPPATTTTTTNAALTVGQLLDINSIVNGIAAIKRHQAAISVDLNELKNSNEVLWQEALASREKYKKQQDTINRILKFLAGVFGNVNSTMHKQDPADHLPCAMMQRKPQMLMIEQGPTSHPAKGVGVVEVQDEEMNYLHPMAQQPSNQHMESNVPPSSPAYSYSPSVISEPPTPKITEASPAAQPTTSIPNSKPSPAAGVNNTNVPSSSTPPQSTDRIPTPTSSLTTTPGRSASPDALQAAFAEMLNSPGQLQRLLAVLSAQPSFPLSDPTSPPPPPPLGSENTASHHASQLTSYDPYHDFSRVFRDNDDNHGSGSGGGGPPEHRFASFIDGPSLLPVHDNNSPSPSLSHDPLASTTRLQKTYRDAEEVDKDVNALHNSITSLIESLGLDPNLMNEPTTTTTTTVPHGAHVLDNTVTASTDLGVSNDNNNNDDDPISPADFDFNAFLNEFSNAATDYGDPVDSSNNTAFLDEIASVSDAATPKSMRPESPNIVPASPVTRKRKSDAIEPEREHTKNTTNLTTKVKRKR